MKLSVSEKVKILAKREKTPLSVIAGKMKISRTCLQRKLAQNALTENDMNEIAKIFDIELVCMFRYPDGTEI